MALLQEELAAVVLGLVRVCLALDNSLGRSLRESLERLGVGSDGVGDELRGVMLVLPSPRHVMYCGLTLVFTSQAV